MVQVPPSPVRDKVLARMRNAMKFKFFLWMKLPAAARAGVTLDEVDYKRAVSSVPFKRATQNPFRSTYFACLAMAAEMSTGILALLATTGHKHSISMLVTNLEGTFSKKATDRTYFTCEDGDLFFERVAHTLETGEPVVVASETIGRNEAGDEIARFTVTWSMKRRSS